MKNWMVAALLIASVELALAHQGATGIVKQRMDLMKDIGQSMKALSLMVRGSSIFDKLAAKQATRRISDHAVRLQTMFPKGSDKHTSEAGPEIWKSPEAFKAGFQELKTVAETLQTALDQASTAADIQPEFQVIAKSCKNCHTRFRVKR